MLSNDKNENPSRSNIKKLKDKFDKHDNEMQKILDSIKDDAAARHLVIQEQIAPLQSYFSKNEDNSKDITDSIVNVSNIFGKIYKDISERKKSLGALLSPVRDYLS